tara:strand:- start:4488 stop:5330 length:843 start_codon:yes stop_codon:yes gene_type:complete
MKIIKSENEIIKLCSDLNIPTSFVPTMGALHGGHIELLKEGKKHSKFLIASLFVNPLQFNNHKDLLSYPRNLDQDIETFKKYGVDILYIPNEKDILNSNLKKIDSGPAGRIMEGKFRPGHFDGVLTIVNKFFEIINPNFAFFGIKDFQQLCLIYSNLSPLHNVNIIPVETVRDNNGLALSSRNKLLDFNQKKIASNIYKGLSLARKKFINNKSLNIEKYLYDFYSKYNSFEIEYVLNEKISIFNQENVHIPDLFDGQDCTVIMVAAKISNVRLIDNILVN